MDRNEIIKNLKDGIRYKYQQGWFGDATKAGWLPVYKGFFINSTEYENAECVVAAMENIAPLDKWTVSKPQPEPTQEPDRAPRGYFTGDDGEEYFEDVFGGALRVTKVSRDYDQYRR